MSHNAAVEIAYTDVDQGLICVRGESLAEALAKLVEYIPGDPIIKLATEIHEGQETEGDSAFIQPTLFEGLTEWSGMPRKDEVGLANDS